MTLLPNALVVRYMNQVCHWEYESTEGVHLPQQLVSSSCCLSQESGLSLWVGEQLKVFSHLNQWSVAFVLCYMTAAVTEVTSNSAISTLLMPILSSLVSYHVM